MEKLSTKYFKYDQFSLKNLIKKKIQSGLSVGLAFPVLNEAGTLKKAILAAKGCGALIDDIIVIDSESTDNSKDLCDAAGIRFIAGKEIAKDLDTAYHKGKGWNLWSSLYSLNTDIIVWIDSDIKNIHPRFIAGVIAPMLIDSDVQFVKGYYHRPKNDARVTEIMVRPFLNALFPILDGIIQPLSGEYGGRRTFLERIDFYSGYSVEIAVLLQAFYSLNSHQIAQVYLGKRVHQLQDVASLGRMSASILHTLLSISMDLKILELNIELTGKLFQYSNNELNIFYPVEYDIVDAKLQKIINLNAY